METVLLIISTIFLASPKMIVKGDINKGGYAVIYNSKGFRLLLEASMYCAIIPAFVLLGFDLAWYWKMLICILAMYSSSVGHHLHDFRKSIQRRCPYRTNEYAHWCNDLNYWVIYKIITKII